MNGKRLPAEHASISIHSRAEPLRLRILCGAALLSVLAACGGGGDGDGGGAAAAGGAQPSGQSASTQAAGTAVTAGGCYTVSGARPAAPAGAGVTLLPALGSAVGNYRVLDDARSAGLCYANYRREQAGLPPLAARDALNNVAQNHTAYMLANQTLTHDEVSGKPGYTGATPDARIQAAYPTNANAEVVAAANKWTSVANAQLSLSPKDSLVADLINAPFHRAALLGSYGSAGSGYAESVGPNGGGTAAYYYQTVDLADASKGGTDSQMVAYPFDGQADVPASWVNSESPNPAPGYDGKTMGYPVSLQAINPSLQFDADSFTITDAQGRNVDCLKVDSRSSGLSAAARGLAICTPLAPLASGQRYSVAVSGKLGAQTVSLNWSFTTR